MTMLIMSKRTIANAFMQLKCKVSVTHSLTWTLFNL